MVVLGGVDNLLVVHDLKKVGNHCSGAPRAMTKVLRMGQIKSPKSFCSTIPPKKMWLPKMKW